MTSLTLPRLNRARVFVIPTLTEYESSGRFAKRSSSVLSSPTARIKSRLSFEMGIRGTMNFRDDLWQGYEGTDIDATVDLEEEKTISEIGAGFYQESGSWIFMPDCVEYFVSADGNHFENVGVLKNTVPEKYSDSITHDFVLTFSKRKIRYLNISAKNIGVCPPWHPGAGGKAWLFMEEIFAN